MKEDPIFQEPMRQLIISMSAWRRLKAKALQLENDHRVLGPILLYYMGEAWHEAEKDMKDSEKDLMQKMKEAMK